MKIANLDYSYGEKQVLNGFSLEISEGEVTCILGGSGAGKTTFLNYLAGLLDEKPMENLSVSMVFQEPRLVEYLTVLDNLTLVCDDVARAEDLLRLVGLIDRKNDLPKTLSGGERQRVNFARAFMKDFDLVLLDEPFSSVDTALKIELCKLFINLLKSYGKTAVIVTHDVEEALMLSNKIAIINGGKIDKEINLPSDELPRSYGSLPNQRNLIIDYILKR